MKTRNAMIVIIDMQNGFSNHNTCGIEDKILAFLKQARAIFNDLPVVGTRYVNHEHTACYLFEGWKDCMDGSEDAEVLPLLRPMMDQIFSKDKYSCWNEEMKNYVREHSIQKIYFCGVNTGCCVLHSAFDCYNDLTDCSVIEDLCGSTSGEREHEAALIVLRSCITKERVISAEQALHELLSYSPASTRESS